MGSTQSANFNINLSKLTQSDFMKQILYIQSTNIPCIGSVQIYRFKEPPYEYIMKYKRVFQYSDPLLELYKKNLELVVQKLNHKNIAPIQLLQKTNIQFHMCGKNSQIQIYSNYYTISLDQIIRKRKKDDIRFTSNEIWYVLKSLLQVSILIRNHKYHFGNYRSKSITLSSEGYIKLYIFNPIFEFNNNYEYQAFNQYTQAVYNRLKIHQNLPLPPEFLPSIKQGNLSFTFNYQKQDSFMIATVILQMMIDQDIKKYYQINPQNFCTYKRSSVWKDLGMLGYIYDKTYLLTLLQKMLNDDPQKRISTSGALQYINKNRQQISIGGSLRMFQDDQNHIKPKVSYRTSFDFEGNVLKTIQPNILEHKLTACPIQTFSKKNNNIKSLGVSLTSSKKSIQTKDKSLNKSRILQNIPSRGSSLSTKIGNKI